MPLAVSGYEVSLFLHIPEDRRLEAMVERDRSLWER